MAKPPTTLRISAGLGLPRPPRDFAKSFDLIWRPGGLFGARLGLLGPCEGPSTRPGRPPLRPWLPGSRLPPARWPFGL
eukprot:15430437-Alexandrium_andersonii.AAC.1